MATVVTRKRNVNGALKEVYVDVTMSASYATGGETVALGVTTPLFVDVSPSGGYLGEWDYANKKLKVLVSDLSASVDGPAVEAASGADLDAVTFRVRAVG